MLNTFPFNNPLIPDALTGGDPIEEALLIQSMSSDERSCRQTLNKSQHSLKKHMDLSTGTSRPQYTTQCSSEADGTVLSGDTASMIVVLITLSLMVFIILGTVYIYGSLLEDIMGISLAPLEDWIYELLDTSWSL
ncbi:hypothetical protein [Selenomonas artemidis]|jgi:hypothetical protein|uniref:hypothetical protein n=1 Tax=Selenomonas artemidis TaxID=671224 RepID=UPI0023F3CAB4|nr:hypothetical protein [Selenomonas artemidis]